MLNQIEWEYLLTALEKFGFGPVFNDWIKVLFYKRIVSAHTSNNTSEYFPFHRGMSQECCLSPYLFDTSIENLAIAIISHQGIHGINRGGTIHKF